MLSRFVRSREGAFGYLTGLLALPLLVVAGTAIDLCNLLLAREQLDSAADVAALGAISEGNVKGLPHLGVTEIDIPEAERVALSLFKAQSSNVDEVVINKSVSRVSKYKNEIRSSFIYEAQLNSMFLRLVGIDKFTLRGIAESVVFTNTYKDFYIVLDNTPSMGIGATVEDISKMKESIARRCAFACHITNPSRSDVNNNTYATAKSLGVTLRIDLVARSVSTFLDSAIQSRNDPLQYRASIYSFGKRDGDVRPYLVAGMSDDLENLKRQAQTVQLMTVPSSSDSVAPQTDFNTVLDKMNSIMGKQGGGYLASDPEKVLFFVTDGVADYRSQYACTRALFKGFRCMEPINPSYCDAIKAKGIRIAILYTEYLPLPDDATYRNYIAPFANAIPERLSQCASPDLFQKVGIGEGIDQARRAISTRISVMPRIW